MNDVRPIHGPIHDLHALASRGASRRRAEALAPSCSGLNFYEIDHGLRSLLPLYMPEALLGHLDRHLGDLGELAGGRLGELSDTAERHPPQLHPRDRYGRDEEWVECHPAYREMERIAFGRFGMHAMTHRPGVLGWPEVMPTLAKQVFFYLFSQSEFGVLCPVNLTDCTSDLLERHGSEELKARYLDQQ